jgi:hypothetical protein
VAARLGAFVAGQLDEVDLVRDRDRPREVGEEDEARLQQRDKQQVAVSVVTRDLGTELGDASLDLLGREKDLTDAGVRDYDARSSR